MVITVIKSKVAVADNYLAIVSRQFRDFLTKNNISIIFTATNHPSKNGIAEFDWRPTNNFYQFTGQTRENG